MTNPGDLQFERAEPAAAATGPTTCIVCKQPLQGSYFAINDRPVCASCRDKVAQHAASGSFVTALLLGLGAAALGAGIYFGILGLTGWDVSLVAVVVGFLVGSAVRKGSHGKGGWSYQGLAIALTYLSVVVTDTSIVFRGVVHELNAQVDSAAVATTDSTSIGGLSPTAGNSSSSRPDVKLTALRFVLPRMLIVPFLFGLQSPLHLVIVGFGLYEAWRLNRTPAFTITGPHQLASSS